MSEHANLGMNKTGVATSPKLTAAMLEGQKEFAPDLLGDEQNISVSRSASVRDWSEPIGSVPPPTTAKGMLKTGLTALKGESPTLLIDKLGARLAYERSGVRLYEAFLSKFDATGSFEGGPSRAVLESILSDEYRHFQLLVEALEHLGADPTVMTPSADLEATITQGALAVLVEPRTNLVQCLEALLTIELIDNDCWESVVALAEQAGQRELAARFQRALSEENAHLANVRRWLAVSQGIAES
jgi:rubrerythrin